MENGILIAVVGTAFSVIGGVGGAWITIKTKIASMETQAKADRLRIDELTKKVKDLPGLTVLLQELIKKVDRYVDKTEGGILAITDEIQAIEKVGVRVDGKLRELERRLDKKLGGR